LIIQQFVGGLNQTVAALNHNPFNVPATPQWKLFYLSKKCFHRKDYP